jgi:hypothetical protein
LLRGVLEEKLSAHDGVLSFRTAAMVRNLIDLTSRNGKQIPSLRSAVTEMMASSDRFRFDYKTVKDLRIIAD